jgi:hypothetical protein
MKYEFLPIYSVGPGLGYIECHFTIAVGIFILNAFISLMPSILSAQSGEQCNDLVYVTVSIILGG